MERDEILSTLDKLTLEDSVKHILDGTISEEDVLQSSIPLSEKEDIVCTYKQVLAIRQRIVVEKKSKQKIQEIEANIVSDQKEYEKPCKVISNDCKYGYQTLDGKVLFPIEFEEFIPLGIYFIVKNRFGKYGVIDAKFNVVIPVEYESLEPTSSVWNKQFIAQRDKLHGVMDIYNNIIVSFKYQSHLQRIRKHQ